MQPQPYFPEAETVHDNIASADYDERLAFIRRVMSWHLFTQVLLAGMTLFWLQTATDNTGLLPQHGVQLLGLLLFASLLRRIGIRSDYASLVLLPLIIVVQSRLGATLIQMEIPVWSMPLGVVFAWIYSRLCGRDFSFLGAYTMAGGVMLGLCAIIGEWLGYSGVQITTSMVLGVAYFSYYIYDLAALLQRRKGQDPWLAVMDLYRDILNFVSYTFRVIHHWRNFRI